VLETLISKRWKGEVTKRFGMFLTIFHHISHHISVKFLTKLFYPELHNIRNKITKVFCISYSTIWLKCKAGFFRFSIAVWHNV
jgi:hypothetical protein